MLEAALHVWEPRPEVRSIDWALAKAYTELGNPYEDLAYPHLSAPGGVLDALDCPLIQRIWLQWGTRLGKTFGPLVGVLKNADCDPCQMLLTSADRPSAEKLIGRVRKMGIYCPALRHQLESRRKPPKNKLDFAYCEVFAGWPRSPATLADLPIRYGLANEVEKWVHQSTSTEADPLELFLERFKEFITFKAIMEGSPGVRRQSRIERGRLASSDAKLYVPCPECGRFQPLRMGDGKTPGGIAWEHLPNGRSDKDLARRTARYVCQHCEEPIGDEARGPMMRAGVWIPEGCGCNDDRARKVLNEWRKAGRPPWGGWAESEWLIGEPLRDGPDYGSQLSSLYALSLTWGDVARRFVEVSSKPHLLRNFINGWLAETWQIAEHDDDWEKLGKRLMEGPDVGRGLVPAGYTVLTGGIDKQADHFVVVLVAWGPDGEPHIVDYGEFSTEEALLGFVGRPFGPLKVRLSLLDTGNRPHGLHDLIARARKRGLAILPCKGSSVALGVPYRKDRLGKNTSRPGAPHVMVDTITTQDWIEKRLYEADRVLSLFRAPLDEHRDFLEQITNDAPIEKSDRTNHLRESWERIDDTIPNDVRDSIRYAFVAYLLRNKGQEKSPVPAAGAPAKAPAKQRPRRPRTAPLSRPGGWLNLR